MLIKTLILIFFINKNEALIEYAKGKPSWSFVKTKINGSLFPPENGVDGNKYTIVSMDFPFFYIVELEDFYIIKLVYIYSRRDCCGNQTSFFTVGLLWDLPKVEVIKNEACYKYSEETIINETMPYKCQSPFKVSKYVTVFRDIKTPDPFSFSDLEVFGEDYLPNIERYIGCYRNSIIQKTTDFKSLSSCTSFCSIKNFPFISFSKKKCFCISEIGIKFNYSYCDKVYAGSISLLYGDNVKYFALYKALFCFTVKCESFCKNVNEGLVDGVCVSGCFPGYAGVACDQRVCGTNNGGCGNLTCITEVIGKFTLNGCMCTEGYKLDLDFSCSDVDECEENIYECKEEYYCINTVGSYECSSTLKRNIIITTLVVIILLLLILLTGLAIFIYKKSFLKETEFTTDSITGDFDTAVSY